MNIVRKNIILIGLVAITGCCICIIVGVAYLLTGYLWPYYSALVILFTSLLLMSLARAGERDLKITGFILFIIGLSMMTWFIESTLL